MKVPGKIEDWVIFEDEDFIIINKPPFISTLQDRASKHSIIELARANNADIQVCHRLDKETSGALLLSKHNNAYKYASDLFLHKKIEKVYHAICHGSKPFQNRLVELDLFIPSSGVVKVRKGAKKSATLLQTIESFKNYSLVECKPQTGRMHQIRVHMAAQHAPLVGDGLYGGHDIYLSDIKRKYKVKGEQNERPLIPRFALHAKALKFMGMNGNLVEANAEYPKDFKTVLKQLRKHA